MAKQKFYAVKVGKAPGIYRTWAACESQVKGFPGARYKSFPTFEEAEQFLSGHRPDASRTADSRRLPAAEFNEMAAEKIRSLKQEEAVAFVDGSYDAAAKKSAYGAVLFDASGKKETLSRAFTKKQGEAFISTRNVAAELEGAKAAIRWAVAHQKKKITVFYDYTGIGLWANGEWQAKNVITQAYVSFIREQETEIEIAFQKVPAHSGIIYNEEVDALAKQALHKAADIPAGQAYRGETDK